MQPAKPLLYVARRVALSAVFVTSIVSMTTMVTGAASNKQLQRLKGDVGYQPSTAGVFSAVTGSYVLPDDDFAVTRSRSAALLTLPDSSLVALGENTNVQVGAFNAAAAGPGATITVNGGTLRFDIHRPTGGAANYHFVTPTSQIGVRGTVGLLSFAGGNTTVACLACAADSISVSVGSQTFSVLTGQVLTVSASGAVATSAVTSSVLSGFSSSGVSTSASSGLSAATSGVTSAAAAGASAATTTAVAAGAAAAVGGVAAASSAAKSNPTPAPTATPTAAPAPTPTPTGSVPINVQSRPLPSLGGQRHAL